MRSEIVERLLNDTCEVCGSQGTNTDASYTKTTRPEQKGQKGDAALDENHDMHANARAYHSAKRVMMTFITIGQGYRDKETGEPDEAISFTSGSEGGWGKRPAMDLARSLPSTHEDPATGEAREALRPAPVYGLQRRATRRRGHPGDHRPRAPLHAHRAVCPPGGRHAQPPHDPPRAPACMLHARHRYAASAEPGVLPEPGSLLRDRLS